MIADILLKKGSGVPSSLKTAEPAVDLLNKILYIGLTEGEDGGSEFMKIIDEEQIKKMITDIGDIDINIDVDVINNLHYYGNKDIVLNENVFSILSGTLSIDCSEITDGELVIPYDLDDYSRIITNNPSVVTKIVIPRGKELINNDTAMSDADLVDMFINLNIIVRVNEDGSIWSYNIEEQSMN